MPSQRWMLTADEMTGRLLQAERTPSGHLHVTVVDAIRNDREEHQRGRSSPRIGKSGHSYATWGHEDDTRRQGFAKEIAVWLERKAEELRIERIAVFAPPRFLGALRKAWSPRFALCVDEHHGNLSCLTAGALARRDCIIDLMTESHT